MANRKLLSIDELAFTVASLKADGKRIVHCHGVFDLLHIGHIRYFQRARDLGDVLVVTVTQDEYVNKGPSRPAFPQDLRAEAVAALDHVDYVAVNQWPTAVETLKMLKPDVYAKGSEYRDEEKDVSGGIKIERQAIESVGGKLVFTDDITFSSSHLLNRHVIPLSEAARKFLDDFRERYDFEDVMEWFDKIKKLKVLVVGETILDEYQYCEAIGKSSKQPSLVVTTTDSELFAGGSIAVANHVASFCGSTGLISQLGSKNSQEEFVRQRLDASVEPTFLYRQDSPTIVKRRFIDAYFFSALFEVYEINFSALAPEDNSRLCQALREQVSAYDLVIVIDFGHSMLTSEAVQVLCDEAKVLAVNAQANAGNLGYHTLSKYPRADFICVAEHEMLLEARERQGSLPEAMVEVAERLSAQRVVVTVGNRGCICYNKEEGLVRVPALASKVVDRVGAGDTYLALTAPCAVVGAPLDVIGFIGNVAGAEAVATVGHRRYLDRETFVKHAQALMK